MVPVVDKAVVTTTASGGQPITERNPIMGLFSGKSNKDKPGIFRENKRDAARYEALVRRVEAHPSGDDAEYRRLNNAAHKAGERVSYARRHRW